jgi:uncharacterized protein (TIGR03083 family)
VQISGHIEALDSCGSRLAAAAEAAGLDAPVPSCPAWRVGDLLRHIGYVHRWAAGYVAGQVTAAVPELTEAEQLSAGPPGTELLTWYRDGHAALVAALSSADPAMTAWTFLAAPSPLAFWARRQAHETAIHCADAELAAGISPGYPAGFAADGVDEILVAFFGRNAVPSSGSDRVLLVAAADTGDDWHVRLAPGGQGAVSTGRGRCPGGLTADCTVTGPASELYLLLWNRLGAGADVDVSGDPAVLAAWRAGMNLTWS